METVYIWLIIIVVLIVILEALLFTPERIGKRGEKAVIRRLMKLEPEGTYHVINDIILNGKYGLTQIDHIVVSLYGVFVLETKNLTGTIYGDARSKEWIKYY